MVHNRLSEAALRRHCRRLLRELDMRAPLDIQEFAQRFAARRGRPIVFSPYALSIPGPGAVTFVEPGGDVVLYQAAAGSTLQRHYTAHELGHLILNHRPSQVRDIHAAGRTVFDSPTEWEAEMVATIILEWAMVFDELSPSASSRPGVERVQRAFTLHRRGWL